MLKRIISAMVCLALISTAFCINAFAVSKFDTKVGDIKLYTDKDTVDIGDTVTVTIYLENITISSGVVAVDFPLTYDRSKLSYQSRECVFPLEWGPYGEDIGHEIPDEDPFYLRSALGIMDVDAFTKLAVTQSQVLGFKVTFKAVAAGEAFIAVENAEAQKNYIMLVSLEGKEVNNYGGNGMTVKVNVTGNVADVSDTTSEDTSADTSADVSDTTSVTDTSVDVSDTTSVTDPNSSIADNGNSSVAEQSNTTVSENAPTANTPSNGDDDGGVSTKTVVIIIASALAAVLLIGGVLFVVLKKKKAKQ